MRATLDQALNDSSVDRSSSCGRPDCACSLPIGERFVLWALRQWQVDRAVPREGSALHRGFKMAGLIGALPDFAIAMDAFFFGGASRLRRPVGSVARRHHRADRLARRSRLVIASAVEDLPVDCRDHAGNALLNVAVEAVAQDAGLAEASRIFARISDLLAREQQPPVGEAISIAAFDS